MSRFKLVNILDSIFLSFVTFLIVFAWLQFFIRRFVLSLFLSVIVAIAILLTLRWFKSRKQTINLNKATQNENLIKFKLTVQTLHTAKLTSLIKKLIPAKYNASSSKGDIHFYKNEQLFICTFCFLGKVDDSQILEVVKTKNSENIIVFGCEYTKEAKIVANSFNNRKIYLITLEQLYHLFSSNDINLDTSNINLSKAKLSFKGIIKNSLSREHSKGYFVSGLILLFTSLIIPYKIYYVVFSSILLGLSLACRVRTTIKPSNSIFD